MPGFERLDDGRVITDTLVCFHCHTAVLNTSEFNRGWATRTMILDDNIIQPLLCPLCVIDFDAQLSSGGK